MFLHILTKDQQDTFLKIAHLVSISDNTLLWDGKTEDELTGETNLDNISLQESEHEKAMLENFTHECEKTASSTDTSRVFSDALLGRSSPESKIRSNLLGKLKPLPLRKQNVPEERIKAASAVLFDLIGEVENTTTIPAAPKIMLYELLLLALADGEISNVEGALLKEFSILYKVEDFIYDELLEHAKAMNREASKTLALILE